MSNPDLNAFAELVLDRLAQQVALQVFDGEPGSGLDSRGFGGGATAVVIDPDKRVHMHAAVYIGAGRNDDERATADFAGLEQGFQVTAVGGDRERCLKAVAKVKAALDGAWILNSLVTLEPFEPGAIRVDRDPSPSRTYVPLHFTVSL